MTKKNFSSEEYLLTSREFFPIEDFKKDQATFVKYETFDESVSSKEKNVNLEESDEQQ